MAKDVDEMCDASSDLKDIVKELLRERMVEQQYNTKRAENFTLRDLKISMAVLLPMLTGGSVYLWNMSNYFAKLENNIAKLEEKLETGTRDRLTRNDFINICYKWQVENPKMKLDCNTIAAYNVITGNIPKFHGGK